MGVEINNLIESDRIFKSLSRSVDPIEPNQIRGNNLLKGTLCRQGELRELTQSKAEILNRYRNFKK